MLINDPVGVIFLEFCELCFCQKILGRNFLTVLIKTNTKVCDAHLMLCCLLRLSRVGVLCFNHFPMLCFNQLHRFVSLRPSCHDESAVLNLRSVLNSTNSGE